MAKKQKTLYDLYKSHTARGFNYPNENMVTDGDICNYLKKEKKAGETVGFREDLASCINKYSKENASNTPDYVLAHFLEQSLYAFDHATNLRTERNTAMMETN